MIIFKGRKIRKLLEDYSAAKIDVQNYALVKELKELGVEDVVKIVIEFFQHKKLLAAKGEFLLEKISDDSCLELILPLIGDPYDEVRRVAKELIKKRWLSSAAHLLLEGLASTEVYLRNNTVELLSLVRIGSIESELISMFNDSESEQKKCIIRILAAYETNSATRLIISALNDSDWQVRLLAVKQIGHLKPVGSVDALIEKLKENEPAIKKFTIDALGALGDKRATLPLLELLHDGDLMVRQKAVDSLIEIADAGVIPEIIQLLRNNDVNVRRCSVEVLRNMKDPKSTAALMQAIKDSDWWVRQIAADSLACLKSGRIVEGFIGLTKDPDENIRRLAVEFFIQVAAPEAYEALLSLLEDPDWWVRERAIEAIGKLKRTDSIKPLLKMVKDSEVCKALPAAFAEIGGDEGNKVLLTLLYKGTKTLRLESMKVLVKERGAECIEELKKCLVDQDDDVRTQAILALKELTGEVYSAEEQLAESPIIQDIIAPGKSLTEAIVVIDLCNSTDIISRYGNSFALQLLKRLTAIVEPIAKREKNQFNKGTGDGFLLTFPGPQNAIRFCLDTLAEVMAANEEVESMQQINLRFAINLGEVKIDDKGDRIGVAVNMAFRIEGVKPEAAIPTEGCMPMAEVPLQNRILVTENMEKEIAQVKGLKTSLIGLYELKGITGLHRIYLLTKQTQ